MAAYSTNKRPRRSGCSGCLGCASIVSAFLAVVLVVSMRMGIPIALVAQSVGRRVVERVDVLQDSASDSHDATSDATSLGFWGERLPADQQDAYRQLLEGIERLDEEIVVLGASSSDVDPSFRAILRDHPELFWLDGSCAYSYTPVGGIVSVTPGTLISLDQVEATRTQIEGVADAFLQTLPADTDAYALTRATYEYIIAQTDYSLDAPYNQSIMSVFLGQSSVCAGYARAFQYLLLRAGIPCAYVEGSVLDESEDHAWNLVCIDGTYVYVDPTWGDPTYSGDVDDLTRTGIIYDYLCLTTEEMLRDRHVFDDPEALPSCESTDYDYYRREGLFFDAYDPATMSEAFWQQEQTGDHMAAFKFANDDAYGAACSALTAGEFMRDELLSLASNQGVESIRYGYTTSDGLRIVKLYW